LLGISQCQV